MPMKAILSRRSVRKYTDQPVSEEMVKELLAAAMSAPSAGNQQPWHFVVIRERALLDQIPAFHPYAGMVKQAPVAILVCGDETMEKYKGFWVQDCAAATENLLIAVEALGLGAVWVGVYPEANRVEQFRKLLAIPDHVIPFALIPVGYAAEKPAPANRFEPSRIHYDRW
ncbi:NADH dehydrogenase/nad(p)h nitroreductase, putative [Heliomicrobium modesticaldum Ice1]|uniref:NADH dehydrogenase/nad(P)h nitroreductase, putative n=2 Tax=Heliomicrobium modesticaldum TaxID=35701 RepID=B0TCN8_HELMI|nr:NADH dehydrogenase/nad(p)h nitroreductase, putative [Heliomicrobium modesticaldum Ice1]